MNQPREHWGSNMGFILAATGSAIGLGTFGSFLSSRGRTMAGRSYSSTDVHRGRGVTDHDG